MPPSRLDAGEFVKTPTLPLTLAPGTQATFEIRFEPPTKGNATAVFALESSDPNTPTVAVPMSGIGL